jgi:hypothetical protein
MTLAERKSSGKVVSSPTERVVWLLLVVRATNSDIPDQAIPNAVAMMRIRSTPGNPEAILTPSPKPITSIIRTCMIVLMASLKSLPNRMEDLPMGATLILSMKPLLRSLTSPIPAFSAEEATVCIMTAAVEKVM